MDSYEVLNQNADLPEFMLGGSNQPALTPNVWCFAVKY